MTAAWVQTVGIDSAGIVDAADSLAADGKTPVFAAIDGRAAAVKALQAEGMVGANVGDVVNDAPRSPRRHLDRGRPVVSTGCDGAPLTQS